jgi:hypothetical protein
MGSLLSSNIGSMLSQIVSPVNQQPTQPTGITSIPVTNQNPTVNMTGGRFNKVRDPRLNRVASRPMFKTSRYDSQISDLLSRLIPQTENKANGGRIGYENGGSSKTSPKFIPMDMESVAKRLFERNLDNLTYNEKQTIYDYIEANRNKKAYGGRIGYADGTPAAGLAITSVGPTQQEIDAFINQPIPIGQMMPPASELLANETYQDYVRRKRRETGPALYANILPYSGGFPGGPLTPRPGIAPRLETTPQIDSIKEAIMSLPQTRSNPQMNAMRRYSQVRDPRIARLLQQRQPRAMGGIMNLKMGGMPVEMDLRAKGGFVPIGKKERADDVPARLSKNEFVFTANAVRNAGNGDIRKGAKRMYNLMHQLEAKR